MRKNFVFRQCRIQMGKTANSYYFSPNIQEARVVFRSHSGSQNALRKWHIGSNFNFSLGSYGEIAMRAAL